MTLDISGAKRIENPSDGQIRSELANLSAPNVDSFLILGPTDMTYIQVVGDTTVGFVIEYQEGSVDAHYRTADEKITLKQAVQAFIAYRDKKATWKNSFTFEKVSVGR